MRCLGQSELHCDRLEPGPFEFDLAPCRSVLQLSQPGASGSLFGSKLRC